LNRNTTDGHSAHKRSLLLYKAEVLYLVSSHSIIYYILHSTNKLTIMLPKVNTSVANASHAEEVTYASAELHLVKAVASKLEGLRQDADDSGITFSAPSFPRACLALMYSIPGNETCMDCGCADPSWASVTYGTLLCLNCIWRHRGMGVKRSKVRSIHMDDWSHENILHMLEGGNGQLSKFYHRHQLGDSSASDSDSDTSTVDVRSSNNDIISMRHKTKAALYYREQLRHHVSKVMEADQFQGRLVSRTPKSTRA
jgi:hypothetical protein